MTYALSAPNVAELMLAARELLTSVILGQEELLADLRSELGAR